MHFQIFLISLEEWSNNFTFCVQRGNICMFKNFRKCQQFYRTVKAFTEKITKNIGEFFKNLLLGYQSFVMPYLHLALKSLFQFVSAQLK